MRNRFATVRVRNIPPSFIHSANALQICKMSKNCDPKKFLAGGLTRVELNERPKFSVSSVAVKNKDPAKLHFYVEPIRIDLSFRWVRIWIAGELRNGTCPYRAIAAHEKIHANLAHDVLREYAHALAISLGKARIPTNDRPLEIQHSEKAYQANDNKYGKLVKKVVRDQYFQKLQEIYDEIGRRWTKLDSKEEYRRVRKSCKDSDWPF